MKSPTLQLSRSREIQVIGKKGENENKSLIRYHTKRSINKRLL